MRDDYLRLVSRVTLSKRIPESKVCGYVYGWSVWLKMVVPTLLCISHTPN